MTKCTLPPGLRRLRVYLMSAAVLATAAAATWGYIAMFTDELVLRTDPATRVVSPDGRWEARLYVEEADDEHGSSVLVALASTGGGGHRQRVVYRGLDAALGWSDDNVLTVREYISGGVRRIDPTRDLDYSADDRIEDERLLGVMAYLAFLPALTVLVVGLAVAVLVPELVLRRRAARSAGETKGS